MAGQYDWWNRISKYVPKNKGPTAVNVFMMAPGHQMSETRGVYTGAGADGQVNPNRAAMMVDGANGPEVVHEGELALNNGNGKTDIVPNAELSQAMGAPTQVAQTPQGQAQIADVQKRMGFPGHQGGGVIDQPKIKQNTYTPPPIAAPPQVQTNLIKQNTSGAPAPIVAPPPQQPAAPAQPSLTDMERSALDFNNQIMLGNNPVQAGIANKAEQNYGAQGQSQFGSMVQTGLQNPDMTEGARNALLVTGSRDLAEGRSNLEGTLATNQQKAAQDAADKVFTQAGTMTKEQQATQSLNSTRLADIVTRLTDPTTGTYTGSLDPATMDPTLKQALQNVWTDSGQTGPMTADWVKQTVGSIANPEKTNAMNVEWNTIQNSDAFKNAPVDAAHAPAGYTGMTQADYKALHDFTSNNGITVGHNADGSIYFKDSQGNVIGGNRTAIVPTKDANGAAHYPDSSDGQAQMQKDWNDFVTANPTSGLTMNDWLKIGAPNSANYNPTSADSSRISNAVNSGDLSKISPADYKFLDNNFNTAKSDNNSFKKMSVGGVEIQSVDDPAHLLGDFARKFISDNKGKLVRIGGQYYKLDNSATIGDVNRDGFEWKYVGATSSDGKPGMLMYAHGSDTQFIPSNQ